MSFLEFLKQSSGKLRAASLMPFTYVPNDYVLLDSDSSLSKFDFWFAEAMP